MKTSKKIKNRMAEIRNQIRLGKPANWMWSGSWEYWLSVVQALEMEYATLGAQI